MSLAAVLGPLSSLHEMMAHLLESVPPGDAARQYRAVLDSDLQVNPGDALTLAPITERVRWIDPDSTLAVA